MSILDEALAHILEVEGGFVDHPMDPGGATKFGITKKTLETFLGHSVTKDDVKELSWDTAKEIYRKNYWDPIRADEMPPAIAVLAMDMAVNSGARTAVKYLQRAVNYLDPGRLTEDGRIGPNTLGAVNTLSVEKNSQLKLIDEYVAKRGLFYTMIKTFSTFGLGWTRRLISTARLAYATADKQFENAEPAGPDAIARSAALDRLSRYFLSDGAIQTYGSFFRLWGGWATAAHVYLEMNRKTPGFATGDRIISPNFLDAAFFGVQVPATRPPEPVAGQKVLAIGYPAGSFEPSERHAEVYIRRSDKSFIARIITPHEPVVVGMSGGIVVDKETAEPIGIIIVRNSPADLDSDGQKDESFDFVALSDVHDSIKTLAIS